MMVKAKTELFSRNLSHTAQLFKALAHPARLSILTYLSQCGSCITGDISEELPLSRTTVNQHLKELKDMGFIKGEIEGARTKYCINSQEIEKHKSNIEDFLNKIDCNQTNCN
jgi:DNA-binding transcriptional ArsR family regulator